MHSFHKIEACLHWLHLVVFTGKEHCHQLDVPIDAQNDKAHL